MKALDGTELCGMRANVEMAKAKEERRRDAQERQLREEMEKRKRRLEERRRDEEIVPTFLSLRSYATSLSLCEMHSLILSIKGCRNFE